MSLTKYEFRFLCLWPDMTKFSKNLCYKKKRVGVNTFATSGDSTCFSQASVPTGDPPSHP